MMSNCAHSRSALSRHICQHTCGTATSVVTMPATVLTQLWFPFHCCRSAVLIRMGVDTISAAEFMQLIQDEAAAKGLSDKRDYNSFLVMPDPADKLASLVFRIASGTQVCYQGCPMRLTSSQVAKLAMVCLTLIRLPVSFLPSWQHVHWQRTCQLSCQLATACMLFFSCTAYW